MLILSHCDSQAKSNSNAIVKQANQVEHNNQLLSAMFTGVLLAEAEHEAHVEHVLAVFQHFIPEQKSRPAFVRCGT